MYMNILYLPIFSLFLFIIISLIWQFSLVYTVFKTSVNWEHLHVIEIPCRKYIIIYIYGTVLYRYIYYIVDTVQQEHLDIDLSIYQYYKYVPNILGMFVEGAEHQDELEVDGVPPYEDRLGPDGAEGENPVLPQVRYFFLQYFVK